MLSFVQKERTMKKVLQIVLCVLLACQCSKEYGGYKARPVPRQDYTVYPEEPQLNDTSIYISFVRMLDDYDWRRDSAMRTDGCEIVLMKDMKEILSIPVNAANCVGLGPDMHHIIDGHLYTDYSTEDETIIKCDGKILLRYPGREFLCGLLYKEGDLYTLGQDRSANGFSLRKNGEVMYKKTSGFVAGSFTNTTYGAGGALFEIDGELCFTYKQQISGKLYKFMVMNSMEKELVPPYDINEWNYVRTVDADYYFTYDPHSAKKRVDKNPIVGAYQYYFFSAQCGFLLGNDLYKVLTPFEKGHPSLMMINEWAREIDIGNGYLTGIYVSVRPADCP